MLSTQIIDENIPVLYPSDTVGRAIDLMEEYAVKYLPVVEQEQFAGLLSYKSITEVEDDSLTLDSLIHATIKVSVLSESFYMNVLNAMKMNAVDLVAVVSTNGKYLGVVTASSLIDKGLMTFVDAYSVSGIFILEFDPIQFSASELIRLVESTNNKLRQLNTYVEAESGLLVVHLVVQNAEVSELLSTFQRHEYNVRAYFGSETFENELKHNYDVLMNYLNI